MRLTAFIWKSALRPDGKTALCLQRVGFTHWRPTASGTLTFKGRFSAMNSKSGPSGLDPELSFVVPTRLPET
jgi:hypothetical protein